MKKRLSLLLLIFLAIPLLGSETDLFDKNGYPVAFIDEENAIYLWDGTPVAYLHSEDNAVHIYGFNGKHLGWYANGVIWDKKQKAIGFKEDAVIKVTRTRTPKRPSRPTPFKRMRQMAPFTVANFGTPIPPNGWSKTPLVKFLKQGK